MPIVLKSQHLTWDTVSYSEEFTDQFRQQLADEQALSILLCIKSYEQYCFNDSSVVNRHVISDDNPVCTVTLMYPPESNHCVNPSHYDTTMYIHRKPTFNDFIDWITDKYGY